MEIARAGRDRLTAFTLGQCSREGGSKSQRLPEVVSRKDAKKGTRRRVYNSLLRVCDFPASSRLPLRLCVKLLIVISDNECHMNDRLPHHVYFITGLSL